MSVDKASAETRFVEAAAAGRVDVPDVLVSDRPTSDDADNWTNIHQAVTESGRRSRLYTVGFFTAIVSCLAVFWMSGFAYNSGVVRTLERRFGLSSFQSGIFLASSDITYMCVIVFVGYFGRRSHKPRIICVTALLTAVGNFLMALPQWLYSVTDGIPSGHITAVDYYNNSSTAEYSEFCAMVDFRSINETDSVADCEDVQQAFSVHPAFYFFLFAQLLNGIGGSGLFALSQPYIDENTSKAKSAFYIGVVSSMISGGRVVGFALVALMLRIPDTVLSDGTSTLQPDDPRWIGCWWLGYLLVSVGILLTSVPLWFFPSTMTDLQQRRRSLLNEVGETTHGGDQHQATVSRMWIQIKEFTRGLLVLLRNPPYVLNVAYGVCAAIVGIGMFLNAARYMEIAFLQEAYVASIISAVSLSLASALGVFLGGLVMSRFKLSPAGAVKLMILSTSVSITGVVIIMFLRCPQVNMAGQLNADDGRFTVSTECSRHCACLMNQKSYNPVCGSDNLTYFSACFAGCTDLINATFVGCQCISQSIVNSTDDVTARPGFCLSGSSLIVVYAVVMFPTAVVLSLDRAPTTIINFRVVDDIERSFALGFKELIVDLLAFVPGPMLFGVLIDSTCRLWETDADWSTCSGSGGTGSCLLFDADQFRWRLYGVSLGFQIVQLIFVILLLYSIRRRRFQDVAVPSKKLSFDFSPQLEAGAQTEDELHKSL